MIFYNLYVIMIQSLNIGVVNSVVWLRGQAVKTSPFHGGNTGSIPVGVIFGKALRFLIFFGPLAQLVRATGS